MTFRKTLGSGLLLAALFLSGCDRVKSADGAGSPAPAPEAAPATGMPAAAPGGSPHFDRVLGKLDIGGKVLQFEDHEGEREMFIEAVKAIAEAIPEIGPVQAEALVDASGLAQSAGLGQEPEEGRRCLVAARV